MLKSILRVHRVVSERSRSPKLLRPASPRIRSRGTLAEVKPVCRVIHSLPLSLKQNPGYTDVTPGAHRCHHRPSSRGPYQPTGLLAYLPGVVRERSPPPILHGQPCQDDRHSEPECLDLPLSPPTPTPSPYCARQPANLPARSFQLVRPSSSRRPHQRGTGRFT